MDTILEKIELVKERTGVTYKEAKDALERCHESVVDAIIDIEENIGINIEEGDSKKSEILKKIKKVISKGNVSRIIVRKEDEILLNLPLTVGLLGIVIAPWGALIAVLAAAGFNCDVEFVTVDGKIKDINGKVKKSYEFAKKTGKDIAEKSSATIDKIKESNIYNGAKEKGAVAIDKIKDSDIYEDIKDKTYDLIDRGQDVLEDLKDKGLDRIDEEKIRKSIEEIKKKSAEIFKKGKADIEDKVKEEKTIIKEKAKSNAEEVAKDINKVIEEVEEEQGIDIKDDDQTI